MKRLSLVLLIASVTVAWHIPLGAQQRPLPVVGVLSTSSPAARTNSQFTALNLGLRDSGFDDGRNVAVEYRWASDDYARLPELAAELVRLRASVIIAAGGHVSALAARDATKTIPIVFTTVTDPVKLGLVASLNKPGGNATGTAGLTSELDAKRLELLHELKPSVKVVGVLVNPNRPGLEYQLPIVQAAAEKMNLTIEVQKAATADEIDAAFEAFARQKVDGVLVTADPFFNNHRAKVVGLAATKALPAVYQWREFVAAGGLMSYGPSITEAYHLAGTNAGLILKGAKPADIPVVQPTKFELVINRYTARVLSISVPPTMIARADEVVE